MQQSDKKSFFDRFKRNQSSTEIQTAEETIKQAAPESTEKAATPSFIGSHAQGIDSNWQWLY
jgi:hypothetical protein